MLAVFTAYAQKAVLKTTAAEEILKLLPDIGRQPAPLRVELGTKFGVMGFYELIEQCLILAGRLHQRRGCDLHLHWSPGAVSLLGRDAVLRVHGPSHRTDH